MFYYPQKFGTTSFFNISINEIIPFINWTFFFSAWNISGKYADIRNIDGCDACTMLWLQKFSDVEHPKAKEAAKLYHDVQELLFYIKENNSLCINAVVGIYPAFADENDNIIVDFEKERIVIPTLRQQKPSKDGFCYSLSDFLNAENDFLGFFASTVTGGEKLAQRFEQEEDTYQNILLKTISDRLVEASTEWLHYKVRTEIWAYSPDEKEDIAEIFKTHYQGIRPAVGYPSLPDQSIIFILDKIINLNKIGISLTENGAMSPSSSTCGLMFAHPKSKYFIIGKIDHEQLADYARRCGKTTDEMGKWLVANL